MISFPIYLFVLIELSVVAYLDFKYKTIKNYWSLLNLILSSFLFFLFPKSYPFIYEAFQFSAVFIFVGFFLYFINIMGGGDSKFLATFFLIIPFSLQEMTFYYLLIVTILIGVIVFFRNTVINREKLIQGIRNQDVVLIKSCFGTKFAYAPVILIAWMFVGWKIFI